MIKQSKSFVATEIKFLTKPELLQKVSVQSEKFGMRFSDIKDLLKYLKAHMETLKTNQDHESYTFVDYNLTYQIQALPGFVSSNINESYFSIRSMVNLGRISSSVDSTYIGGESTISFNQVEKFIDSLEKIIAHRFF